MTGRQLESALARRIGADPLVGDLVSVADRMGSAPFLVGGYVRDAALGRQSSDLDLIKRAGDWIMSIRPPVDKIFFTPNFAGGLLAILVPIPIALRIHCWRERKAIKSILAMAMVIVILLGLFLTAREEHGLHYWLERVCGSCGGLASIYQPK